MMQYLKSLKQLSNSTSIGKRSESLHLRMLVKSAHQFKISELKRVKATSAHMPPDHLASELNIE